MSEGAAIQPFVFGVGLRELAGAEDEYLGARGSVVAGIGGVGRADRGGI